MDFWTKGFLFLGLGIAIAMFAAVLMVLGTAENGMLTTDGLAHMSDSLASFYGFMKILVFIWIPFAVVWLFRLIRSVFGR